MFRPTWFDRAKAIAGPVLMLGLLILLGYCSRH